MRIKEKRNSESERRKAEKGEGLRCFVLSDGGKLLVEGEKGQGETFVNVIRPSLSLGELAELGPLRPSPAHSGKSFHDGVDLR